MKKLILLFSLSLFIFSCGDEVIEDKGKGQEGGIKKTYYGNGQIKSESKYKNDHIAKQKIPNIHEWMDSIKTLIDNGMFIDINDNLYVPVLATCAAALAHRFI